MFNIFRSKEEIDLKRCMPSEIKSDPPEIMVIKPPKVPLFKIGEFKAASGLKLDWKVECDILTEDDWIWAARHISRKFAFHSVFSISTGGDKFMFALDCYTRPEDSRTRIICDDVLTTGRSMEAKRQELLINDPLLCEDDIQGVVLFQRRPGLVDWIYPIWRMWD